MVALDTDLAIELRNDDLANVAESSVDDPRRRLITWWSLLGRRAKECSKEIAQKGMTLGAPGSRIKAFKAAEADVVTLTIEIRRTPKIFREVFTDLLS